MAWHKLGQIFVPGSSHRKLASHAANPLAVRLSGDVFRIFFSGRDAQNRSSVGAVDIDIVHRTIVAQHAEPFFTHGPQGSFYEAGVSIGNIYTIGTQRYMGFMGWQNPPQGHWRGDIGRLLLHDDGNLSLDSATPLMGVNGTDPISLSYPFVLHDGERYRMWYGSTIAWDAGNGEMLHVIKHAHSPDGHQWHRDGLAVPYIVGEAQAFSRPAMLRDTTGWHMWFSYRSGAGETYRIGYAHSSDGLAWELQNENAGITVSEEGWDSEMICYPYVFEHNEQRYMLYNGNGYGRTGFGLAQWH